MWDKEGIFVLVVLTLANLYTYLTRYIPSSTKDLIKDDLELTDMQTGLIFTVFISCYMIVSPLIGVIADHKWIKRKVLIVIGLLILSVATFLTGLCDSFSVILLPRILFGMGESIFCTISPTYLSDFFDPVQRNLVMSIFFAAIPIGCALGYTIASSIGQAYGWQRTFEYLSLPGVLSLGILFLREPEMGERDRIAAIASAKDRVVREEKENAAAAIAAAHSPVVDGPSETASTTKSSSIGEPVPDGSINNSAKREGEAQPLLHQNKQDSKENGSTTILNGQFVIAVLGYIACTFGMGGFSDWLPTFFTRYHGMTLSEAGLVNGVIVVVGGLFGTLLGGIFGDLTAKFVTERHPLILFSGVTMLIGGVSGLLSLTRFQDKIVAVELLLGGAVFFGWCYNGPINAVVLNSVTSKLRSRANGVCTLLIHLFGDAISPTIIGLVSDSSSDLRSSLLIVPMSLFVATTFWLGGFLTLPAGGVPFCKCCKTKKNKFPTVIPPEANAVFTADLNSPSTLAPEAKMTTTTTTYMTRNADRSASPGIDDSAMSLQSMPNIDPVAPTVEG